MSDRGLDPRYLAQFVRRSRHDVERIHSRISQHLDAHDGYVSYSGGKDSIVTLDLTLTVDPTVPVVFFDSGLEFPETYQNLADVETRYGITIDRIAASPPLLELLKQDGSWNHDGNTGNHVDLHTALITQPAALAHATHGPGVLWGVRAAESPDRSRAYRHALASCQCTPRCTDSSQHRLKHGGAICRNDGTVAYGPIWNWSATDVWSYIHAHELPENRLYARMRSLGAPADATRVSHVIDGLRLTHGRVTWLARGWPSLFHQLHEVLPRIREFV